MKKFLSSMLFRFNCVIAVLFSQGFILSFYYKGEMKETEDGFVDFNHHLHAKADPMLFVTTVGELWRVAEDEDADGNSLMKDKILKIIASGGEVQYNTDGDKVLVV